ncbi:exocyst subunit exo70 family protein D3 [Rhynchospora pubera]|uniref:Exocyst subunit Exo70 family protein n=1 Tax=Rhynchospora pubera TaxID=906938 RepID=A0AAV8HD15_9POAL|nr:exocyst subunit exo70 family protein D3 [Rhynchospora pubera]
MDGSEELDLEVAEQVIMRWESTSASTFSPDSALLFSASGVRRAEAERYLRAVDRIRLSTKDSPIAVNSPRRLSSGSATSSAAPTPVSALQTAMARLEDEFRHILVTRSLDIEIDSLIDLGSLSINNSSVSGELFPGNEDQATEEESEPERSRSPTPVPVTESVSEPASEPSSSSLPVPEVQREPLPRSVSPPERECKPEALATRVPALVSVSESTPTSDPKSEGSTSSSLSQRNRYLSMRSIKQIDLFPPDAIEDLRNIASRMIASGYWRECMQVYGSARKPSVDHNLRRLGIEKLSIGDVQRLSWETLASKVGRWIRSARAAIRIILASERRLCEMIFDEEGLDEAPFAEAVKGAALQVLGFAEANSIGRRSPEKLFKMLDMYECLSDLMPDISAIFNSKSTEPIRQQAEEILLRLGDAARGILSEFENAVIKETSKSPVPGGTIHPLTRYVMNYLMVIPDYTETLAKLITSRPSYRLAGSEEPITIDDDFPQPKAQDPIAYHVVWIIFVLHRSLDIKTGGYKDVALSHLFVMNNIHYIVHKVKDTEELQEMVGEKYLQKLALAYTNAAISYERATWLPILRCLRDEGLHVTGGFSSSVSKSTLRERFRSFNASFEEAHRLQSMWQVPDTQLKEELRMSIGEKLLPAYRSFLGRFRQHIETGKHPELLIKYSVEDLEEAILDFFEGTQPPSILNRRRSH